MELSWVDSYIQPCCSRWSRFKKPNLSVQKNASIALLATRHQNYVVPGQVFDVATVNMAELGKSIVGRGSNGSNFGV